VTTYGIRKVGKVPQEVPSKKTNISPKNGILMHFEDDFPFPQVGYVNPLEGSSGIG